MSVSVLVCAAGASAQVWLPPAPLALFDPALRAAVVGAEGEGDERDGQPTGGAADAEAADEVDPEVVVHLKDGRVIRGLLAPGPEDQVTVRVEGVPASFRRDAVERVERLPPLLDRYRELRAGVGDDAEQILRLARWLQARERYELALSEARRALAIEPGNVEAGRLATLLEEQVRLKALRITREGGGEKDAEGARERDNAAKAASRPHAFFPTLNPAQINLIKVYELDLEDKPRMLIPRASVERMLDAYAEHPAVPGTREGRDALMRRPAEELVALMFELRAREFYGEVQVLDTPKSILSFRDSVQRTWLSNACATTQCHGGAEAGRLALTNRRPGSEASVFTNLLILTRFRTLDGRGLINWEAPERSVLLQYGLPRKSAITPHPEVPMSVPGGGVKDAWRPAFRSQADPMFRAGVRWIESMRRPRSDWPVEYTPLAPLTVDEKPAGGAGGGAGPGGAGSGPGGERPGAGPGSGPGGRPKSAEPSTR